MRELLNLISVDFEPLKFSVITIKKDGLRIVVNVHKIVFIIQKEKRWIHSFYLDLGGPIKTIIGN